MKKLLLTVAAIVVLAIIALFVRKPVGQVSTKAQTEQSAKPLPEGAASEAPVNAVAQSVASRPAPTAKPSEKLAYAEAVKRYGAQRIQFNAQCQATPTSNIYKAGIELMLDNRAEVERSIVFSGKTYHIAPYDYTVVKLTTPGITYIDCGSSQNVAKITIEK